MFPVSLCSIHWCPWAQLCQSKSKVWLGFHNLGKFHISILAKQRLRLLSNLGSLVACMLNTKYYPYTDFIRIELRSHPSYTWHSIWNSRGLLDLDLRWKVGNGRSILVRNDFWLPRPSKISNKIVLEVISTLLVIWWFPI